MSITGSSVETLSRPPTYTETDEHKSTYAGGNYCSTDKKFVANIRVAKKGAASLQPKTVGDIFAEAAQKCGSMPVSHIFEPNLCC